ncbi:hypothetical protein [Candidatus Palauibacter sp.]|uniref:hypothetical protein n=1 Tax=Candidatus Palauibacter sp. TaxID=3101350 RepID=UPI003B018216
MPPADFGPEEGRPPARRQGRPPVPSTISQEQLERVIRRASELQFRSSTAVGGSIESQEVVQIGAEVGLDERHVRQALAEVQAASLLPETPEDSGLARRLFGPAIVSASRVVPGTPADVEANLESHLSERELLQRVRSRPGRTLWEPAAGLVPQMRRNLDFTGRGYALAKARSLQVVTEPLENGWSLVTMTADMRNVRTEHAGWLLTMLPLGGIGGAVGLTLATGGGLLPILGGVVIVSGATGLGAGIARGGTTQIRRRMELALQGLLDRLESGEDLVHAREPWHQKLPW